MVFDDDNPRDGVFDDVHLPMFCSVSMRDDDNKPIHTIEKHNIIVYKCVDCVLYCNKHYRACYSTFDGQQ